MMRLLLARLIAPKGYAVVPRDPTNRMRRAACKAMAPSKRPTEDWVSNAEKHAIRYRAMIDAA